MLGQGDVGQLGLGEDMVEKKRPYPLKSLEGHRVVQVVCGGMHTAALTAEGKVSVLLSVAVSFFPLLYCHLIGFMGVIWISTVCSIQSYQPTRVTLHTSSMTQANYLDCSLQRK